MVRRILIDAVHPEEIRVALEEDSRLEEFDFESASKKQIKSNIYLGKVTRVEPSLQAVFVEYGGNRQGFLPFSEIHYDYYQIPEADKKRLEEQLIQLDEERKRAEAMQDDEDVELIGAPGEENADEHAAHFPEDDITGDEDPEDDNHNAAAKGGDDDASISVTLDDGDTPKKRRGRPRKADAEGDVKVPESAKKQEEKADVKSDVEEESSARPRSRRKPKSDDGQQASTVKSNVTDAAQSDESTSSEGKPVTARKKEDISSPDIGEDVGSQESASEDITEEAAEEGSARPRRRNRERNRRRGGRDRGDRPERGERNEESRSKPRRERDDFDADMDDMEGDDIVSEEDETARARAMGRSSLYRQYKIQEVIKRNQIVLVQVIKEERGNKGASLTTYISLAGRCCVLMPNTDRAGGVSRRIQNVEERRRLKSIVASMELPKGASVIVRTAGVGEDEQELKRDYEYLLSLWEDTRRLAVSSQAPALIHEEGTLIKRSLRDLYRDDVDEVLVEGKEAYQATIKFLENMAPKDLKKIKEYSGSTPVFKRYGIDDQLEKLYDNRAELPSGGSIVIVPTEALVSIDVNSGKSTRERSIEDTALKTNIEAAHEIARQLRLRDLAGLVVIDFIDMREMRNRRIVEKELKDALRADRAKIQIGRISMFGLLEMSRQRMRSSLVESSTRTCPHCNGLGQIRSEESSALSVLRAIESEAARDAGDEVTVRLPVPLALYILNRKRDEISAIEERFSITVIVQHDYDLTGSQYAIDRNRNRSERSGQSERSDRGERGGDRRERGGRNRNNRDRNQRDRRDQREPARADEVNEIAANAAPQAESGSEGGYEQPANEPRENQQHGERRERGGRNRNNNRNRNRNNRDRGDRPQREHGGNQQAAFNAEEGGNVVAAYNDYVPDSGYANAPREAASAQTNPAHQDGDDSNREETSRLRGIWKKITQ